MHIANGLFRAVCGGSCDIGPLVLLTAWQKHGQALPDRTFDILRSNSTALYQPFEGQPEAFERFRRFVRGLMNADTGLFPAPRSAVVSLTCAPMISASPNDRGVGKFAAAMLGDTGNPASLASLVAAVLRVTEPSDPLTALAWPLLPTAPVHGGAAQAAAPALARAEAQAILGELAQAADCLAGHERRRDNRLRTLQRVVSFSILAALAHAQALAANGDLGARTPLLMVPAAAKNEPVADASERLLERVLRRFADWLTDRLVDRLRQGLPLSDGGVLDLPADEAAAERLLAEEIQTARRPASSPDAKTQQERRAALAMAWDAAPQDPARALAQALTSCYEHEVSGGGPRPFLLALGWRVGLFYPHGAGRAAEKRVRPTADILDTLVRCCVPADEVLSLEAFLDTLWERFGLIVGGRRRGTPSDEALLRHADEPLETGLLRANTDALVDRLERMGLARRFADQITYVGDTDAL